MNLLCYEQLWAPHPVDGETIEQVADRYDGDMIGTDPKAMFRLAAHLRRKDKHGPPRIASRVGVPTSTVYAVLR